MIAIWFSTSLYGVKDSFEFADTITFAHQQLNVPVINHMFFCPDHNIKKLLLGLINTERVAICAALFQLTDIDIARALILAHERGVRVEIVLDHRGAQEKHCKIALLRRHKVPVYVCKQKMYAIMHNKIFIFARTIYGKSLAWSGSANATLSGMTRNEENVFITQSSPIIRSCRDKIVSLKHNSAKVPRKSLKFIENFENCASLLQFLLS